VEPKPSWFIRFKRLFRRLLPWLLGLAVLVIIGTRVPLDAFREAVGQGPHISLAALNLVVAVITLGTDALSTWTALLAVRMRRPFSQVLAVRGATFVLFLINYALGQGAFGYYLHRTGVAPKRAVGATLFLMGTNLATLLLLTTFAWGVRGVQLDTSMWWTLVGGSAAFGLYLVVIALRPHFLARIAFLTPLFDAGIGGHAFAMVGRIPHLVVMTLGIWVGMVVWGIPAPFSAAATVMPVVVIIQALPLAPAGMGTTQAALVYFFAQYAAGATADERAAHVFAFAIVQFVYMVAATLLVGIVCVPFARRNGGIPPTTA
jgi:hypothetical protein